MYDEDPYTGNTASLYWNFPLIQDIYESEFLMFFGKVPDVT